MNTRKLFTKLFWLDASERVVATAGEVFLGFITVPVLPQIPTIEPKIALTVTAFAALASLVKSVVAAAKADTDTASFTVDSKPLI